MLYLDPTSLAWRPKLQTAGVGIARDRPRRQRVIDGAQGKISAIQLLNFMARSEGAGVSPEPATTGLTHGPASTAPIEDVALGGWAPRHIPPASS